MNAPETTQILQLIDTHGMHVNARAAEALGVSRQAVSRRLKLLEAQGLITASGTTRSRKFALAVLASAKHVYSVPGLSEDIPWRELVQPVVGDLAQNIRDIWHYGITEMVNNAIDHSGSQTVEVVIDRTALHCTAMVIDQGEGIFLRIQRALGLYDTMESILELAKGKLTTDPANHSGEGIFFSSKMFDAFDIRSRKLHFMHDAGAMDVLAERPEDEPGTLVFMRLSNSSTRIAKEVFNEYAGPDEYTFDKTIVPVRLAAHEGEKLVSRSQAKRLTARFERFRHVVLDFAGISEIGQAFADEVFRVFEAAHPKIELVPMNTTADIDNMISRAHAHGRSTAA